VPSAEEARRGGSLRIRLDLDYDGTDFSGWAVQPGRRTVAGVLGSALATVLRVPETDVALVVAGRTDAGVHANGQVCHVDVPPDAWRALPGRASLLPPAAVLLRRLRGVLAGDVRVRAAAVAPPGFDARFSALRRRYAYRLSDDPAGVLPLRRRDVAWAVRPLDVTAMDEASRPLAGLHDFAPFCRRREGATTVRTLQEYTWVRDDDGLVVARVVADAFCHSMVRSLVGAAVAVGDGRRPVTWLAAMLAGGVRDPGVVVAPPHGLVLEEVAYPPDAELAARAAAARAVRSLPAP
jgi:tRNA pseudouridine38-40 synthase